MYTAAAEVLMSGFWPGLLSPEEKSITRVFELRSQCIT